MSQLLFGDYETRSPVDIKKCGADVYARHPKARVMAFGYAFDDDDVLVSRMGEPPEPAIIDHIASGGLFVAHNAHFEWVVWNYVWRKEWPFLPELKIEQCICTMVMAYSMALPGSLEFASAAAGIDMQKDTQGVRIMLQLACPKTEGSEEFWEPWEQPEKFERMYKYCGQDVLVERGLYKRLAKMSETEKIVWDLDHKINQRGVQIDLESAEKAMLLAQFEQDRLNKEIQEISKNSISACTAVSQIKDFVKSFGIECEGVAKNDIADLLETPLPPEVRQVLLLRQEAAKTSVKKLQALTRGACDDGRARGLFQYHGAQATGRWAGRRVQLQNLPRQNKLQEHEIDNIFEIIRGIS